MFSRFQLIVFGVAALGASTVESRGDDSRMSTGFVMTLMSSDGAGAKPSELSVVFLTVRPDAGQVDPILRKCIEAAVTLDGGVDIVSRAWFSKSIESSDREPISLKGGNTSLVYRASDKSITASREEPADPSSAANTPDGGEDNADSIVADASIGEACKAVAKERLLKLAAVAIESRGERRSQIVRGLRTWCKGNDVTLDKGMSLCVVAISKAAHKESKATAVIATVVDAAGIKRGTETYKTRSCSKCHRADGRGGARGPDLTDNTWDHCDGSIEGISKVILSGVPQDKLKDPSRPFAMNPVARLSGESLTDLAAYVHSLSKK